MRHTFCPECGNPLSARALGDEGLKPSPGSLHLFIIWGVSIAPHLGVV